MADCKAGAHMQGTQRGKAVVNKRVMQPLVRTDDEDLIDASKVPHVLDLTLLDNDVTHRQKANDIHTITISRRLFNNLFIKRTAAFLDTTGVQKLRGLPGLRW